MGLRNLIAVVIAIMITSGCSSSSSPLSTYEVDDSSGMSDGALLTGTLTLSAGCLHVEQDEPEQTFVPVFAEGTVRWADEQLSHQGRLYEVGDVIELAGGATSLLEGRATICDEAHPSWVVGAE